MDLFRSPDGHNDNRCAGLFGNVENTVVKREQFSGFASGALRIYTDRDLAALKQIRSFIDRPQCLSRVLPVDRHKAAFPNNSSENRNLKILRLGNERQIPFLHDLPCKDRVKIGAMVSDKHQLLILRYLLQSACIYSDSQHLQSSGRSAVSSVR